MGGDRGVRLDAGWRGTPHGARRRRGGWLHSPPPTARSPGRRGVSSRGGGASSQAPRGSALTQPTSGPRSPSAGRCRSRRPPGAPGPEARALHRRAPLRLLHAPLQLPVPGLIRGFARQGAQVTGQGVVSGALVSPGPRVRWSTPPPTLPHYHH